MTHGHGGTEERPPNREPDAFTWLDATTVHGSLFALRLDGRTGPPTAFARLRTTRVRRESDGNDGSAAPMAVLLQQLSTLLQVLTAVKAGKLEKA